MVKGIIPNKNGQDEGSFSMVKTDSRLMTHAYGQSSTPSENSEENHAFSRRQPSAFNLPPETAEYRNT